MPLPVSGLIGKRPHRIQGEKSLNNENSYQLWLVNLTVMPTTAFSTRRLNGFIPI
jgi:hypothetical protein